MLALKMCTGKSIFLWFGDEKVEIKFFDIKINCARIGIKAGEKVRILRDDAKKMTKQCFT